jgi:NADPH2:quinone reductase
MPVVGETPKPRPSKGEVLIEVLAAPLNPVDVSVCGGGFFGGQPPLPYIPGVEAVGRVLGGSHAERDTVVFVCLDGLGIVRNGTCAERALARDDQVIRVAVDIDPVLAAAAGTAGIAGWSPLVRRAPIRKGDVVVVLGATGTVGLVAVQAAKVLGAERVVAVGRRLPGLERARELGADAVVQLAGQHDLAQDLLAACGGTAPTYIFDPLWGEPLVSALRIAAKHARIVQLGQSCDHEALIPSSLIRGKDLDLLGFTNINLSFDALATDYLNLLEQVAAGRIRIDVERVPLSDGVAAWKRLCAGAQKKLVICP